ncbi:MAG: ribose-phosphate diphosphokinase [Candidatus Nezhaarchaeales archaeon]
MTIVVAGPASLRLSEAVSKALNVKMVKVEHKSFPDGEAYIRLPCNVKDEDVVIIQSLYPDQNRRILELLFMIETAKDLGAQRVIAVVPYFAYARQDKRFRDGEAISSKVIAKLIELSGANALVTVDVHSDEALKHFKIPALNVSAAKPIGEYLSRTYGGTPFILAPDEGRMGFAKTVASVIKTDYGFLSKKRDLLTGEVRTEKKELPVKGRIAVIVDDIISTGGTIANAARILIEEGAKWVVAACTHLLAVGDAVRRMKEAGVNEILGTDSVESTLSKVSVAGEVAEALKTLS